MVDKPPVDLLKTDPMRFWLWTIRWLLINGKPNDALSVVTNLLDFDPPTRDVRAELCAVWHTAQEEK